MSKPGKQESMQMHRSEIFILAVVLAATTASASDTLRCGSKLVETGMTMAEVKNYCGKPSSSTIEEQDVRSGNRVIGTTQLHIWTYDRASGQNSAVLEFDQDKLLSITFVRK
jgi:hypothetical protein